MPTPDCQIASARFLPPDCRQVPPPDCNLDLVSVGGDVALVVYDHLRRLKDLSQFQIDHMTPESVATINRWMAIVADSSNLESTSVVTVEKPAPDTSSSMSVVVHEPAPATSDTDALADAIGTPAKEKKRVIARETSVCSSMCDIPPSTQADDSPEDMALMAMMLPEGDWVASCAVGVSQTFGKTFQETVRSNNRKTIYFYIKNMSTNSTRNSSSENRKLFIVTHNTTTKTTKCDTRVAEV